MPFLGMSQNTADNQLSSSATEIHSVLEFDQEGPIMTLEFDEGLYALKKVDHISADPRVQNKMIYYKKSKDIISVKAYIRSLQMKRKETLMS